MSDHRGAWGAHGPGPGRDDAVWWQDQQQQAAGLANLQHQLAAQHQQQLAAQLQHQQQQQQDLAAQLQQQQQQQQQLFNYKMASSFPNAAAAVSSSSYDLGTVNTINTSIAGQLSQQQSQQQIQQVQQVQPQQTQVVQQQQQNNQWWYPGGMQNPQVNNTGVNMNLNAQQMMNRGKMPRKDAKPRGRMTAYAFFVQTCREEHKKQHPDENVVFAEFSKKCAERWKTMLDKEKKRFHEMAEKDKKRYDTEMQDYVPPVGEKRGKKRKQVKDPNAPKRSLSAFFWFCNDERGKVKAANPEMTVGEIAKELGRRWSDITPELKNKYEQMAEKDKARYERDMTAYKKKPMGGMPMPNLSQQKAESDDDEDDDDEGDDDDE